MSKDDAKLALVVSDLHCGSNVGLLHPNCEIVDADSEKQIPQRPYQKWLWSCWEDFLAFADKVIGRDKFVLIVNGDCIEGVHHGGKQIISPNPADHVYVAETILAPLAKKASRTYIIRGTECHTQTDEHALGKKLGAVKDATSGLCCWDHLSIRIGGCLCSFRHHMSTTSRTYLEAGSLSAHLANEQLECVRAGWPIPTFIARAHRHRHGCYDDGCAMALVTAAWQGETRHVHKVAVASISRPSGVVLDWRGLGEGELPAVHRRVYSPKARDAQ